ncbi:type I methionyl aminopeptidase, partial [Bombella apis]
MSSQDGRSIQHYTTDDFRHLKAAGQLAAATLDMITEHVRPGITTGELDRIVHEYTLEHGATPAPLNYHGFPKSCCISLNHVVCHGIPGDRRLQEGDILNIDVTSILNGWYGDTSRMYVVGKPPRKAEKLIDLTYQALMLGIEQVRPGATLGDIGHAIQSFAEKHRLGVVRDFCGHGIGRNFHEAPSVLHYGRPG